jgi:hypothetical protein
MSGRRTWSNRVEWKMEIGSKNRLKMWIIHPQLARRRGRARKKMPRRGMLSSISRNHLQLRQFGHRNQADVLEDESDPRRAFGVGR